MYKFVIGVRAPIKHSLTFAFVQGVAFYINLKVLLPFFFDKKRYITFGILNIILLVVGTFGTTLLEDGLSPSKPKTGHTILESYYTVEALLAHSVPVFIGVFIALIAHIYLQRLQQEQAEKERVSAEKNFLIQQINPHFLFNALNNIYSLSIENNPKVSDSILQLSKMLDYSLYGNNEEFVSLKDEIAYIENLIALFKLKDDEITNIVFDYKNVNTQSKIAPMLLLPFVENAFKHGNIEDIENGNINIELSSTNHKNIDFKCYNTYNINKKTDKIGGIGITNVKRRLELLYPNNYKLTIENNEHQFKVHLKIQHNA